MIDSLIVKLLQQTFMPKMHQNTFGSWAPPRPARELKRSPGPSSRNQEVLLLTALKKVSFCRFAPPPQKK